MSEQKKTQVTGDQKNILDQCLRALGNWLGSFQEYLRVDFHYYPGNMPAALAQLIDQTGKATQQILNLVQTTQGPSWQFDNDLLPVIKRSILEYRRTQVRQIQTMMKKTPDPEIAKELQQRIDSLDIFNSVQWFQDTAPVRLPRLTDYFTLKRAEELLASPFHTQTTLPEKKYADKFSILSPASSVDPEFDYWRHQCDMREVGLALAYFDIDNFKRNFNEPYTETVIDRNCLPVILRAIEAHTFFHGFAYHEGGDEFIILVPNIDKEQAISFMDRLRLRLPTLRFVNVNATVTVSIGICHINPDCPLTDAEVRQKANEAKKYAKKKGGKNCIVTYKSDRYVEQDLMVVRLPQQ